MNKNFSEWYRAVKMDPAEEILQSRSKGIEKYCEGEITFYEVLELARLFFKRPVESKFREGFINAFYEVDKAFPQKKNEFELAVLAGATLVHIIEKYNGLDNIAILALLALTFNKRKMSIPGILLETNNIFISETTKIRKSLLVDTNIQNEIPSNATLLEGLKSGVMSTGLANSFSTYFEDLDKLLEEIKKNINTSTQIYREDSQILWWMTGEWSRDLKKPFKQLKCQEAAIIAGKELADLIEILPGPNAAKAVLYKLLSVFPVGDQKDRTFSTVINMLSKNWKGHVLEDYQVDKTKEITPVLTAISSSLAVEGTNEWKPIFKKLTDFEPEGIKIPLLELSYQVYLECLLVKSIRNNGD